MFLRIVEVLVAFFAAAVVVILESLDVIDLLHRGCDGYLEAIDSVSSQLVGKWAPHAR